MDGFFNIRVISVKICWNSTQSSDVAMVEMRGICPFYFLKKDGARNSFETEKKLVAVDLCTGRVEQGFSPKMVQIDWESLS